MTPKPQNTNYHQQYQELKSLEAIVKQIDDAFYTVHKNPVPGLPEKAYAICFWLNDQKGAYLTNVRLMFQSF